MNEAWPRAGFAMKAGRYRRNSLTSIMKRYFQLGLYALWTSAANARKRDGLHPWTSRSDLKSPHRPRLRAGWQRVPYWLPPESAGQPTLQPRYRAAHLQSPGIQKG